MKVKDKKVYLKLTNIQLYKFLSFSIISWKLIFYEEKQKNKMNDTIFKTYPCDKLVNFRIMDLNPVWAEPLLWKYQTC